MPDPALETGSTAVSRALTEAPIVAHVVRGGFVESVHRGTVVVTAPDGSVEWALGDPTGAVFARSANKPIQASAMVRAGLDLPDAELALACASHSGEPFHREAAARILEGAGLTEADLQNTPDYPIDEDEQDAWIRAGRAKAAIAQNCSGKHAAMLATCVVNGWDTAAYRHPEHPLQRAITDTIVELTGEPVVAVTVDGCGAPAPRVSRWPAWPAPSAGSPPRRRARPRPASTRRHPRLSRSTSAVPAGTSPTGARGRRAHRQGRRRVRVCGGAGRRTRRRGEDRRRLPAGEGRRPRRGAAPPRRRRPRARSTDAGQRARCSGTANRSARIVAVGF